MSLARPAPGAPPASVPSVRLRRLLLALVLLSGCARPPSPAPAPSAPTPPPSASQAAPAPTPPPAPVAPVVTGEPRLVAPTGLRSFASKIKLAAQGTIAVVVDQGDDIRVYDPRTGDERAVLRGHSARVNDADPSPGGDLLVSASADDTAALWDMTTGAMVKVLSSGSRVYEARISPDGATIATAHEGVVKLFDRSGKQKAEIPSATAEISFSADGTRLLTVERRHDSSKDIAVIDTATGAVRFRLAGGNNEHRTAAFSPDGSLLAFTRGDRVVSLVSGTTGAPVRALELRAKAKQVGFSPDGSKLAVADEQGAVHVFAVATGRRLTEVARGGRGLFAFSPDGRLIAAPRDEGLGVFDASTGAQLARLRGSDSWVVAFAFTPDGARIVGSGGIHTAELFVWDVRSGNAVAATRRGRHERRVAWVGGGQLLATLGSGGSTPAAGWERGVRLWDTARAGLSTALRRDPSAKPLSSDYHQIAASDDGKRVAAGNSETVSLWDTTTGRHLGDLATDDFHTEHPVAFQPKGKLLASAGGKKHELRFFDAATGKLVRSIPSKTTLPWSLSFRPDGQVLAAAGPRAIELFDMRTFRHLRSIDTPVKGALEIAWSPDGKLIAAASGANQIALLDPESGATAGMLSGGPGALRWVTFSADSALLASGGDHGGVRVFRVASREQVALLPDRELAGVGGLAFHPTMPLLASAQGSLNVTCLPNRSTLVMQAYAVGGDLAGVGYTAQSTFGGDPAAFGALRFRLGDDVRAPLVGAAEVAGKLARAQLGADFAAACNAP